MTKCTLGEELANIFYNTLEKSKQSALDREMQRLKSLQESANYVLNPLPDKLKERALKGFRWGVIQRNVKTIAKHWPPRTTTNKNICRPEDLIEESAIIYQACVEKLGLNVQIRYWQEHDSDEPLAYIGGYEMVAVW